MLHHSSYVHVSVAALTTANQALSCLRIVQQQHYPNTLLHHPYSLSCHNWLVICDNVYCYIVSLYRCEIPSLLAADAGYKLSSLLCSKVTLVLRYKCSCSAVISFAGRLSQDNTKNGLPSSFGIALLLEMPMKAA